jgi:hypothetical protein
MRTLLEDADFIYKLRPYWNIYVDDEIFSCSSYTNKNIAILLETKSIVPNLYQRLIADPSILENFEMVFTHDRSLLELDDKIKYLPMGMTWIHNPAIRNKTKLVSMISSSKNMCDGHRYRLSWVDRLYGQLDFFGTANGGVRIDNKETALDDYMFSVAIENASYSGYFTEKIIDCFATGTIPIYYGDPDIGQVFDDRGIIKLTEDFDIKSLTPELYKSKLRYVVKNFDLSKEYWSIQDYLYNNYLKETGE